MKNRVRVLWNGERDTFSTLLKMIENDELAQKMAPVLLDNSIPREDKLLFVDALSIHIINAFSVPVYWDGIRFVKDDEDLTSPTMLIEGFSLMAADGDDAPPYKQYRELINR